MTRQIVELDVRDMTRAKQEPFAIIMEAVSGLGPEDVLELHATFRPDPLLKVLGKQGFANAVVQFDEEHFVVQFYKSTDALPYFHFDNRELDPPQPMVRTLEFLDGNESCKQGTLGLEIWNVRTPAFLLPELDERGFVSDVVDEGDGTVRIKIHRNA